MVREWKEEPATTTTTTTTAAAAKAAFKSTTIAATEVGRVREGQERERERGEATLERTSNAPNNSTVKIRERGRDGKGLER